MYEFLKAYISGAADVIYFKFGVQFLLKCGYFHSEFAWAKDHGVTNRQKNCRSYFMLMISYVAYTVPIFLDCTTQYCVF